MALGKRAPSQRDAVSFGDFLTVMPTVPLVDTPPSFNFPMDGNDSVGDCVIAGWDHVRQTITGLLTGTQKNFTQDEIWAFYKTQNPSFDPKGTAQTNGAGSSADNGMDIQVFLEWLVANKYILGFAKIDYTNEPQMRAAIYLGLGIVTGVVVAEAQMGAQFNKGLWDYVASSPKEGGHCIPLVGYIGTPDQASLVTWAKLIQCTEAFITNQMDEAWFVLMQEHVDHPNFRNHFDLPGFAQAVSQITGGKVIIPVNPTLKFGSKGSAVVTLQEKLNEIIGANLVADGAFGSLTQKAVEAFQKKYNLSVDGIVGKMTWQAFTTIETITSVCITNNVEPLLAIAVACWEGGIGNPNVTLKNTNGSIDRGVFQINNGVFPNVPDSACFDVAQACQWFCTAVLQGHLHGYWYLSQPNWIKMLTPAIIAKYNLK